MKNAGIFWHCACVSRLHATHYSERLDSFCDNDVWKPKYLRVAFSKFSNCISERYFVNCFDVCLFFRFQSNIFPSSVAIEIWTREREKYFSCQDPLGEFIFQPLLSGIIPPLYYFYLGSSMVLSVVQKLCTQNSQTCLNNNIHILDVEKLSSIENL